MILYPYNGSREKNLIMFKLYTEMAPNQTKVIGYESLTYLK